ncbi:carboxypeptidase B-like [Protopterus annectens]|uniref:carboxypeptidase B-like n=1 Tax=Protopterus annectens TaxID=7888 RepID=UPI001CF95B17|nr:carboxypeptidase B-like [Protopterus annectens]
MMLTLVLGLATVLTAVSSSLLFHGEKVYRVNLQSNDHIKIINKLHNVIELDFWYPESVNQLSPNTDVDFHVSAAQAAYVQSVLEQSGIKHFILIDDLQEAIEKQHDSKEVTSGHSYWKYNTWEQIASWTAQLSSDNPSLVSRIVIGTTYEGRPMYLLKLGKRGTKKKKAIFMDCGIHAREWISPVFCQWFVKEVVHTHGMDSSVKQLIDNLDIYVLPVFNIDGYTFTWTGSRLWRKSLSNNPNSICVGTDLNRNFNASWCSIGASRNPCAGDYCGSGPESEIETRNVANFIREHLSSIKGYISIHSYSQILLFPYGYTYLHAADHEKLSSIAKAAVKELSNLYGTEYKYGPISGTIYPAAGGSDDWAYDKGIKYSFTFELRDTGKYGFLLPESLIEPTCKETMLAVKYILNYILSHNF